ncbi:MAG: hypothetical protein ABI685_11470 [Ferruginibacter sp.]
MNNTINMSATFETEKNRKAFAYTAIICGSILLIALLVSWKLPQHPPPVAQEFIEINLGNDIEGFGEVQPLIKGEKSPASEPAPQQQSAAVNNTKTDEVKTDDNTDPESAPITKPIKTPAKVVTPAVVVAPPAPKPQKPKIAGYNGPKGGTGNGATEDNGYKYQGNKPGGTGDAGSPSGKPDSYGNTPGGKTGGGGLRVSKGDRTIVNNYIFMGNLPPATINAKIKVSPEGRGTFVTFDKGSTNTDSKYAEAIRGYLPNIEFNKSDHESIVTVPFNFRVQ